MAYADYNKISNNTFIGANEYGIRAQQYSDYNNITLNLFNLSGYSSIYIDTVSTNCKIWKNDFIGRTSADQLIVTDLSDNHHFNLSNEGNFWIGYYSQSQGCTDLIPTDGICDSQYEVDSGQGYYDYYPSAHMWTVSPDCGEPITGSLTMTGNLVNATGGYRCPQHGLILNTPNVELDCSYYLINASNNSNTYGIYSRLANNTNLSNCNITGFNYNVMLNNSNLTMNDLTVSNPASYNFYVNASYAMDVSFANLIFNNPNGILANFTNLSITDSVSASSVYSIIGLQIQLHFQQIIVHLEINSSI